MSLEKNPERIQQQDYLQEFNRKLSQLQPYPDSQKLARRFGTDKVKLYPEKLTGAVLWWSGDNFEILLSNKKNSGYYPGIHDAIALQYGLEIDPNESLSGYLITTSGKKYLIINWLSLAMVEKRDKLLETLKRYEISVAFSNKFSPIFGNVLDENPKKALAVGDYTAEIDQLISGDIYQQIAREYNLTVSEFLRLRLTKKLPKDRKFS